VRKCGSSPEGRKRLVERVDWRSTLNDVYTLSSPKLSRLALYKYIVQLHAVEEIHRSLGNVHDVLNGLAMRNCLYRNICIACTWTLRPALMNNRLCYAAKRTEEYRVYLVLWRRCPLSLNMKQVAIRALLIKYHILSGIVPLHSARGAEVPRTRQICSFTTCVFDVCQVVKMREQFQH
jgi:hypothetical protein